MSHRSFSHFPSSHLNIIVREGNWKQGTTLSPISSLLLVAEGADYPIQMLEEQVVNKAHVSLTLGV